MAVWKGAHVMADSIAILNYFRRSKVRKELRAWKRKLLWAERRRDRLQNELDNRKNWRALYEELVGTLNNVPRFCALKHPEKYNISTKYPLRKFELIAPVHLCIDTPNPRVSHFHQQNLYYTEVLVEEYEVNDCVHFELITSDARYCYQYSKRGIQIQSQATILGQVAKMLTRAWYDAIHKEDKANGR